jgi:hypothetical protein
MKALIVLLLCLSLIVIAQPHQPQTSAVNPAQRFQLVSARVSESTTTGGTAEFSEVFMVDTQTGNTWKYSPTFTVPSKDGNGPMMPDHFAFVFVDNINGDYEERTLNYLKSITNINKTK